MSRRSLILAAIGVLATMIAIAYFSALPHRRISHASYAAIKPGMTRDDVIDLCGPSGNHVRSSGYQVEGVAREEFSRSFSRAEVWRGNHFVIEIGFDAQDNVTYKAAGKMVWTGPSIWQRLRSWLGF